MISKIFDKRNTSEQLSKANLFFVFISIFTVYISPFWWGGSNTSAASVTRLALALSVIIIAGLFFLNYKRVRIKPTLLSITFIVFIGYLFFNAIFISDDLQAVRRLLVLFLLFFSLSISNLSLNKINYFIVVVSLIVGGFALFSLFNQYLLGGIPEGYRQNGLISSGNADIAYFGNTIVAAMHYAIGFVFLAFLFFTETKKSLFFIWALLLLAVTTYIALTFARTGWIAAFLSFLVVFLFTFDRSKKRFYSVALVIFCIAIYFIYNYMGYEINQRGLTYRDQIWKTVLSRMEDNWFFGHGLLAPFEPIPVVVGNQVLYVHNAHSLYLEVLYQAGMIGLIFFLCTLVLSLLTAFKVALVNKKTAAVVVLAMLGSVSIVMLTELNGFVHSPNLIWMWLWIPLALVLNFERRLLLPEKTKII